MPSSRAVAIFFQLFLKSAKGTDLCAVPDEKEKRLRLKQKSHGHQLGKQTDGRTKDGHRFLRYLFHIQIQNSRDFNNST